MTHDSGHLVIGILLFAVAIAMLAATVSWFYVIGDASRQADCGACWCSKTSRALVT
jgi:hypothetical protein